MYIDIDIPPEVYLALSRVQYGDNEHLPTRKEVVDYFRAVMEREKQKLLQKAEDLRNKADDT